MFGLFGGYGTIKEVADEVGIDRGIFGTALTEMKFNYVHAKNYKKALLETHGELESVRLLAMTLVPTAIQGLSGLQAKYTDIVAIHRAQNAIQRYIRDNQSLFDEMYSEENTDESRSKHSINWKIVKIVNSEEIKIIKVDGVEMAEDPLRMFADYGYKYVFSKDRCAADVIDVREYGYDAVVYFLPILVIVHQYPTSFNLTRYVVLEPQAETEAEGLAATLQFRELAKQSPNNLVPYLRTTLNDK